MNTNVWKDRRVLIVGAARQGLALARFFSQRGARVTLNDMRHPHEMESARQSLQNASVHWELGHHSPWLLREADVVFLSGGVPHTLPLIQEAVRRGIPLSNDSQVFMEHVAAPVIGITGSAGKTTTTTLVGRMAEQAVKAPQRTWVGGNIGVPLIDVVDQIRPEDLVVLEFSSFQLELMDRSPHIGALLNVTPNHLDRHGTMDAYAEIKQRIFQFQDGTDWTILGCEDPIAWGLHGQAPGRLAAFGASLPPGVPGACLWETSIALTDGHDVQPVLPLEEILLRGRHNLLNVLAACSIAQAAGFPPEAMRAGVHGFRGVPHRLEYVRTLRGAAWYNDSKATTPEGSMAAIRAFNEPKVVLLGGRDKHLPWDDLAALARQTVDHVLAFGEAAEIVMDAFARAEKNSLLAGGSTTVERCQTLEEAVIRAAEIAEPGDVVLLAPGGTSFDEFNNYEERGDRYKEWVNKLS